MQTQTLPLNQLKIDAVNVRKIGRGVEPEFVASIKAHGILLPLIVRPNGTGYVVTDGGKRLEAAQALVKSGDLAGDAPIPVIVASERGDAEAREISLTLNLIHADMHAVDAYRAFSALHTDKEKPLDVAAIASRFGIEPKVVEQQLALGALHDDILNAWVKEEIQPNTAQAFTLCPNKKDQVRIFNDLKKKGSLWASAVKAAVRGEQENVGRKLMAVGFDAYEARGGKVTRDLFGDDHMVSDTALLHTMVEEKLSETCQKLMADGWKFAIIPPDNHYLYGQIQGSNPPTPKERKRLSELAEQVDDGNLSVEERNAADAEYERLEAELQNRAFTAKQKASAGCFVMLSDREGITISHGRTEPKQVEKPKGPVAKGQEKPADAKPDLTKIMTDRLNQWRHEALRQAIITSHEKASPLTAMIAGIVAAQINPQSSYNWAPHEIQRRSDQMLEAVDAKIMNAALRKAFDAKGYFEGCGKALCIAAIREAVNADEARKVAGKKRGELAKIALTNVGKTGWLPKELRTRQYDGPGSKAVAAKPKAKAKKS